MTVAEDGSDRSWQWQKVAVQVVAEAGGVSDRILLRQEVSVTGYGRGRRCQ